MEVKGDNIDTWTGGSFLTAVSSHDEVDACIYLYEDVEQTDENFEDVSQIEEEEEEEGGGLSLEDIVSINLLPVVVAGPPVKINPYIRFILL